MSNERSPRDVCSITIGISGLIRSPCCRGSTISSRRRAFPCRASRSPRAPLRARPRSASRPRRAGRAPPAAAGPRAATPGGRAPRRPRSPPRGRRPAASACSRIRAFTSSSETSMPAFSATASSASSRATDCAASARICAVSTLRRLAGDLEVGLRRDAAARERADEAVRAARARASRRAGRPPCTFEAATSASTAAARNAASISSSSARGSAPRCRRAARASVSNSLAERASSSSTSGSTFSLTCLTVTRHVAVGRRRARRRHPSSRRRSRRRAPPRSPRRAGPSRARRPCRTGLARRADEVDDERVALLRRPVVGRDELRDGLRAAPRAPARRAPRDLGLGARHLERRPVDDLGRRLHLDRGRERPRLVVGRRQLEVVLGCDP